MPVVGRTRGTADSASFVMPAFAVGAAPTYRQVPVGIDRFSGETVYLDPFRLYHHGLESLNVAFIGAVGNGKSSLMKTFLERMLRVRERLTDGTYRKRRAVIIDRKIVKGRGEYHRLAEVFDCHPLTLGHGQCLNPLDERLTDQQQLSVLEGFLLLLLGRPLTSLERKCARGAYAQARRDWRLLLVGPDGTRPFLLADVHGALMHLASDFIESTLHPASEVKKAAAELAFALEDLMDGGSLRGLFDGPTTAIDWTGQVIDVTIHPDYLVSNRQLVYDLLTTCLAVWLDRAWQSVDPAERVDFFVVDEAWDAQKARHFAEALQDATKLGRSRGLCAMLALHGASDVRSAGDQEEIATRALEEVETYCLFRQSAKDANLLREVAGLTDDDVKLLESLDPHCFLLVVGSGLARRRFLVDHVITDDERTMVDSDRD